MVSRHEAFARDALEVGRRRALVAIQARVVGAEGVDQDDQDTRSGARVFHPAAARNCAADGERQGSAG
jgi:hypothetical protein